MNIIHNITLTGSAALAVALIALAAVKTGPTPLTASEPAESLVTGIDAEALWRADCAGCHGRDGRGQTRAGRRAGVEDYTDFEHQKSFSDERAFKSIKAGKYENDDEIMKPFGKGFSEENGLTDDEILALVEYTRTFSPVEWTEELNKAALEEDEEKEEVIEFLREHGPEQWKERLD